MRAATLALVGEGQGVRFGIAVSGGPDSMALLHLVALAFPGQAEAITVDHGLRLASADEAAMVARWCDAHAIPHATRHPETPLTGNVQDWARTQRYALIEQWRTTRGIDWIMTAHHADDQLETLLMRLNRGAGVAGLAGVRARTGHIIRPLLGFRKAQLLAIAQAEALPYVDDPSNADPRFDRAALRTALSEVDWLNPLAASRSAAALAEADAALEWSVADLAAHHVTRTEDGYTLTRTDVPREYLRRLLLHMLTQADSAAPPPRGDTIDRAIALAMAGRQSSIGAWLLRGGPVWTLRPAPARRA
ncbi:MAG: tRNA lysidine(34) synthetase TilS [Sphingobium sp.]